MSVPFLNPLEITQEQGPDTVPTRQKRRQPDRFWDFSGSYALEERPEQPSDRKRPFGRPNWPL